MSDPAPFPIVSVALNRPLRQCYDYRLVNPGSVPVTDPVGCRVEVSFAGATESAVITAVRAPGECTVAPARLKEAVLLDSRPVIAPDVLAMLSFGSRYYHCPLGQVLWTAQPKLLREGRPCAYEGVPALEQIAAPVKPPRSTEQIRLLSLLATGPRTRRELRDLGISAACEGALLRKNLVRRLTLSPPDTPLPWPEDAALLRETPPTLNHEQADAVAAIVSAPGFQTFLLNGITGSGKTEVYLQAIAACLKRHRRALVLVPEIALTPQTFARFYGRFGVPVVALHSQLSDRERLDAFLDAMYGRAAIVLGTRSALFAPLPDLGLIVIDEEHDSSFHQSDGFRYHARALAILRARENHCPIVLGSATPSLETYYMVRTHLAKELTLTSRAGGAQPPDLEIIDMRAEPVTEGLNAGIGETLENRIGEETVRGNQVLLFLNRRGYSHHLLCHQCGHIFMCPHCDNPLTVHRRGGRLNCHICEHVEPYPGRCPECGSTTLVEAGFGTEQVEEYLQRRYPDLSIERIDRDSVKTSAELERRLERVRSGESKILLGTQLVAKGHDFPDVTLVGIIDIDAGLFSDDFRALEYTAQLITQVAGRAGRALRHGSVCIETHHPDNALLNAIINPQVTYSDIAATLLNMRGELKLPPYSHQALILANSPKRDKAFNFLMQMRTQLEPLLPEYGEPYLSPVLSNRVEKKGDRHYFHMLLQSPDRKTVQELLDRACLIADQLKSDVRFAVETDPLTLC